MKKCEEKSYFNCGMCDYLYRCGDACHVRNCLACEAVSTCEMQIHGKSEKKINDYWS